MARLRPYIGDPPESMAEADQDRRDREEARLEAFTEAWLLEIRNGERMDNFIDALTTARQREEIFNSIRTAWRFNPHSLRSKLIGDAVLEHAQRHAKEELARRDREAEELLAEQKIDDWEFGR